MRNCEVTKKVVCRCSCRYTVYHNDYSNHLDQNIGIFWHKRSMLVNDNTAECGRYCNVSQEKKNYRQIIYDGAISIKETF